MAHGAEKVSSRNAYILAGSAALGSIFYGWDIGLIGGVLALQSFKEYFGLDKVSSGELANINGNIVSVLQGGCFFGALGTGYISSRFGRRPSLLASGVIYLLGSLIQSIVGLGSSQQVALRVLYFSRFLGGIGVGMVSALVPSYVSECVPRTIRGRCTGAVQLANNIGIMLSFWVNYSASKDISPGELQWRIPFIMQEELTFWQQFGHMADTGSIALRCFIPSLVMFFQQWTGTNAINYFSPQIFAGLGIDGTTAGLFATGIYGVVKVVAVGLVLLFAVEGLGRKRCLIIGGLGQGAMMLWIGGYSKVHTSKEVDAAGYVSIVAVYLYAVFYCIGWGPLPWVVAGEVAPNHLRTAALSVAIGVNWLFSFTISKLTPIMLDRIKYGTFLLFGFCCLIMAIWAYAFLPETAGYALEDIKHLFEGHVIRRALQDAPGGSMFLRKAAVSLEPEVIPHVPEITGRRGSPESEDSQQNPGEVQKVDRSKGLPS